MSNNIAATIGIHERRARMVDALNKSLEIFISHHEASFNNVLSCGLKTLAEAMEVHRIVFYRLINMDGENHLRQTYRWDSKEGGLTDRAFYALPDNPVVKNWLDTAMQDVCFHKKLSGMSEDEMTFLNQFGIKSLLIVPVFLDGQFWGGASFQDCILERDFDVDCMDLYRSAARLCVHTIAKAEITQRAEDTLYAFQHREKMMETLVKTAVVFLSRSKDLSDDMMSAGVGLIAEMLKIDRLSVWYNFMMPDGLHASQIFRWNSELGGTVPPHTALQRIPYSRFSPRLQEILEQGESAHWPSSLLPETAMLKLFGVKSAYLTPVFVGNVLWGFVLFADSRVERQFDDVNAEMMRSAAFLIANTVIRAEMEREITDENELNRVMFNSVPMGLTLFDNQGNSIECNQHALTMCGVTKQYYIENFYDLSPEYQPDGAISREKIQEAMKRTLNGENQQMEWMHCSLSGEPIPCELTMTRAMYKGKYIGVGYVYDLRNIKKMEQMLGTAIIERNLDVLTGINNRRFFDENLKRLLKSLSRSGGTLSLLLIDIDFFKNYNDSYGHLEGDKCLKTIAGTLAQCVLRTEDFAARYGGEEFALVLPNTDEHGARMIAKKLHEHVRKCDILHKNSAVANRVTISIGGTTGIANPKQSVNDYIKKADEMLYQSKQNGRSQSSFCPLEDK